MPNTDMNDLKKFKHGEEGTHYACEEIFESKGQWSCCGCSGHKCKPTKKKCCKAHDAGFAGPHCNNPVPSPTKEVEKKCDCKAIQGFHLWSCGKPKVKAQIKAAMAKYQPSKRSHREVESWEKEFDKIKPNKFGVVISRPEWVTQLNESQLRSLKCFACGERFDTAIQMGYWKYDTGQKICRYCEPEMNEKRLSLRDRLVKDFIRKILSQSRKEVLEEVARQLEMTVLLYEKEMYDSETLESLESRIRAYIRHELKAKLNKLK